MKLNDGDGIFMNDGNSFLEISGDNNRMLNPEFAPKTEYAVVMAPADASKSKNRYVYFVDERAVVDEDGIFTFDYESIENEIIDLINQQETQIDKTTDSSILKYPATGLFQINPAAGDMFAQAGIVLYQVVE